MVTLVVPTPLRSAVGGQPTLKLDANTVSEALHRLQEEYPAVAGKVLDDNRQIHRFINVFVNGKDVRDDQGMDTPLKAGDELAIVPAIAGGRLPWS